MDVKICLILSTVAVTATILHTILQLQVENDAYNNLIISR